MKEILEEEEEEEEEEDNPLESVAQATGEESNSMEKDPVCGMEVDPSTAKQSTEYLGKTYYFCAAGCRKAFETEPQTYLAPDYRPSM